VRTAATQGAPRGSVFYDPKIRGIVYQASLVAIITFLVFAAATNAVDNLQRARIASGFGFLSTTAGFDVNQALVPFSAAGSTYGDAFIVGLLNTLLVAAFAIVLSTILGFIIGIARLSKNWVVAKVSMVYVEVVRNVPLLLQLLFWYHAVLAPLPNPRDSIPVNGIVLGEPQFGSVMLLLAVLAGLVSLYRFVSRLRATEGARSFAKVSLVLAGLAALVLLFPATGLLKPTEAGIAFLNNRGFYIPRPIAAPYSSLIPYSLIASIIAVTALALAARVTLTRALIRSVVLWLAMALIVQVCTLVWSDDVPRAFLLFAVTVAVLTGLVAARVVRSWASVRQRPIPLLPTTLVLLFVPVIIVTIGVAVSGNFPAFEIPERQRFNLRGGLQIFPEFVALLLGLVIYTAAFIAEIVRAGIMAVSRGQTEAATALGLRPGQVLRFVVIPQAMRVITPPLTSQYLNATKNSSLAVAIGYPDLVQVFMGTVLNQTGQAIEVVAITMAVYLTISLLTSLFMNMYNRSIAIVER